MPNKRSTHQGVDFKHDKIDRHAVKVFWGNNANLLQLYCANILGMLLNLKMIMPARDSSSYDYYVIAAMCLALLLYVFMSQYLWYWLTYDLRDVDWVLDLINTGSTPDAGGTAPLAGIDGRFVWAASAFVLLLLLVTIVSVSAYILLARLERWRKLVISIATILLIGVSLAAVFTVEENYKVYSQEIFFEVTEFNFIRYLLFLLQDKASVCTLNGLAVVDQLLPLLVFVCNLFLIAALIGLVMYNRRQSFGAEMLISQFACFRLLLFLGSALFTLIALYHMSQYGWLAQMLQADNNQAAQSVRQIQRGVTLYIGTINSVAIVLLYFPPGWILWRRAQLLCQAESSEHSRQARADWLADKELMFFSGPAMRIIVAAAPLLTSGAIMLLEQVMM